MRRALTTFPALVARTIASHGMVRPGDRVLVAVSGGPDSVGLLAALSRLRRRLDIELVAAHVNHRLRGADADEDERCAAENAAQLGVAFVRTDLPENLRAAANLEARARALRYAALHRLAAESGCRRIATGHTQDDQAETLLLRLIRGTGSGGLAGVQPRRRDGVVRPLIERTRAEVEAFVCVEGLRYRTDGTNADVRYRRARIRHEALPLLRELNPKVTARLARAAALFAAERPVIAAWADEQAARVSDSSSLVVARLAEVPAPLRGHVVRRWLARVGSPSALTAAHVDAVVRLAMAGSPGGTVSIGGGAPVLRTYDRLVLTGASAAAPFVTQSLEPGRSITIPSGWRIAAGSVAPASEVELPADLWRAVCAADGLSAFTVRPPRRGDRLRPVGLGGSRKLADVFIDRKVPAVERKSYPVVEWAGQIVWVPGLVRTEILLVGADTRTTVSLVAVREP